MAADGRDIMINGRGRREKMEWMKRANGKEQTRAHTFISCF